MNRYLKFLIASVLLLSFSISMAAHAESPGPERSDQNALKGEKPVEQEIKPEGSNEGGKGETAARKKTNKEGKRLPRRKPNPPGGGPPMPPRGESMPIDPN